MTLFQRLSDSSPKARAVGLLVLRIWFGLVLAFGHGLAKVADLPSFVAKVGAQGFPLPGLLAPAAALSEFVGGLLLAIGLASRPAALFVVVTMLVAALHVHASDPFTKKELAFAYGVAALTVLVGGPGHFSVDAWLVRKARN
jgi:putative oxidoreductase